jgi:hypothetical protein
MKKERKRGLLSPSPPPSRASSAPPQPTHPPTSLSPLNSFLLYTGTPYIFAMEPHGTMPVAMSVIFNPYSGKLPPSLPAASLHPLASSACFYVPFVRHLWWWLGIRPVSRTVMSELLARGHSVCLNPGGVVECLRMQPGREMVYLRQRRGFIKLAMETGAQVRRRREKNRLH